MEVILIQTSFEFTSWCNKLSELESKGGGFVKNTNMWFPSLLRIWWLHVSAALLGHPQVTRCTIEDTIQYIDSSCQLYSFLLVFSYWWMLPWLALIIFNCVIPVVCCTSTICILYSILFRTPLTWGWPSKAAETCHHIRNKLRNHIVVFMTNPSPPPPHPFLITTHNGYDTVEDCQSRRKILGNVPFESEAMTLRIF